MQSIPDYMLLFSSWYLNLDTGDLLVAGVQIWISANYLNLNLTLSGFTYYRLGIISLPPYKVTKLEQPRFCCHHCSCWLCWHLFHQESSAGSCTNLCTVLRILQETWVPWPIFCMWCARNEVKCVVGYFQRSSISWSRFYLLLEDVEDVASPMAVNQLVIMPSLTLVKIQVGFEKVSPGRSVKNMRKRY